LDNIKQPYFTRAQDSDPPQRSTEDWQQQQQDEQQSQEG
jgi:hypothetical protein